MNKLFTPNNITPRKTYLKVNIIFIMKTEGPNGKLYFILIWDLVQWIIHSVSETGIKPRNFDLLEK